MSEYPGPQLDPDPDHEGDDIGDTGSAEPAEPLCPESGQPPQYPPQYPAQYPPPYPPQYPAYPPQYPAYPAAQQPGYPQQSQAPAYPPYQQPGQPGQPGQSQYPQPYVTPGRPTHPKAGLSLGLGLGGLLGSLMLCGVPLLLCPFAWAIGHRARKDIERSGGQLDGYEMARAGMICGIIGTVLLVLAVLGLIVLGVGLTVGSLDVSSATNA